MTSKLMEAEPRPDRFIAPDEPISLLTASRSQLAGLGAIDMIGVSILALLPVALLPNFFYPTNLRSALVLAVLPLGAFLLGRRVVQRDLSALLGAVFVALALVAALRAEYWTTSVFGTTSHELSVVAMLAAFGWWAIAREFSDTARRLLLIALTAGAGVNVLVGFTQVIFDPKVGIYRTFDGRLSGLMSNPVFFASTYIGVWAYWHVRAAKSASRLHIALAGGLAFCLALSGSRAAMAIIVGTIFVTVMLRRRRIRAMLVVSAASIAGIALGTVALNFLATEQNVRYSSPNSGLGIRVEMWRTAIRAWSDRPALGWGPNPYLHEVNSRHTDEVVRTYLRVQWPDPHNVVVLVLVSVGILGLLTLVAFVIAGSRGRIDVALYAAAGAIALSWMLQPVMITSWPIAFALFGAAVRPRGESDSPPIDLGRHRLALIMTVTGALLAVAFGVWSLQFGVAQQSSSSDQLDSRAGWLIHDPEVAGRIARAHLIEGGTTATGTRHLARAQELAELAVARSRSPRHWQLLVEVQIQRSDARGAFETAEAWAEAWPSDPLAFQYLGLTANLAGEAAAEAAAGARACQITQACDEDDAAG